MLYNFNAASVQPTQPMEPVPEGWYPVVISDEEQIGVKGKPSCWYLKMTMDIIDGPFKGRKLFTNLNLGNDSQQTVEIAHRELSAICHVTGQFVLNEQTGGTAALKNKPFQVKAVVFGNFNEIKGFKDAYGNDPGKSGGAAPQGQAPQTPTPPPAQAGYAAPPAQQFQQPAPQGQQAAPWGAQAPAAQQPQQHAPAPAQAAPWGAPQGQQAPQQAQQPAQQAAPWGGQQQPPAQAQPQAAPAQAAPWQQGGGAAPAQAAPWSR